MKQEGDQLREATLQGTDIKSGKIPSKIIQNFCVT